jgi:hypothetical protein
MGFSIDSSPKTILKMKGLLRLLYRQLRNEKMKIPELLSPW